MKKEDSPWSGGPLGPYNITRRYRGIGGGLGRLYEARNNETGNAALVLMPAPGGDLRPEEDWQVRATSNVTPPYLALEVERAPEGGQAEELTWMLDLWATALVRIDERPDTQAHLAGGSKESRTPPGARLHWPGGGMALSALLALMVLFWPRATSHRPGGSSLEESPNFTNRSEGTGAPIMGYPMPTKPLEGQQKPPCEAKRAEKEIRGGCWLELAERAPCPVGAAEYQGRCYVAVRATPPVPTSIEPGEQRR